jgi:hypothetical protein
MYAFVTECFVNLEAIQHMRLNRPGTVPLRRDYLDKIMPYMSTSHPDVAGAVQKVSVRIDRVNGTPMASPMYPDLTGEAMTFILKAANAVTEQLKEPMDGPEA